MSKVYVREGNELVEKAWENDCNSKALDMFIEKKNASLRHIPIHPSHLKDFEFGKEYEKDIDFTKPKGYAIPKPKETNEQDDIWEEIKKLWDKNHSELKGGNVHLFILELKQIYTIHKK